MMFPHPMFMAMIGHAVADMQRTDLEDHVQKQEVYAEEMRQRLETTSAYYQELYDNHEGLRAYAADLEAECVDYREREAAFHGELQKLRSICDQITPLLVEAQQELAVFKEEWGKKISAYEALKPLLQKLADFVCDDGFQDHVARVRQRLLELLERLP